jgi:hypothetical protein
MGKSSNPPRLHRSRSVAIQDEISSIQVGRTGREASSGPNHSPSQPCAMLASSNRCGRPLISVIVHEPGHPCTHVDLAHLVSATNVTCLLCRDCPRRRSLLQGMLQPSCIIKEDSRCLKARLRLLDLLWTDLRLQRAVLTTSSLPWPDLDAAAVG